MGNSQSVADTFFPDNPNRRTRAKELALQVRQWAYDFQKLKAEKFDIISQNTSEQID
jgi:hypothetical protein